MTLKELADKVLTANNINWIPLRYVVDISIVGNKYELLLASGGCLTLTMQS